jgi:cell division topological specificity factor
MIDFFRSLFRPPAPSGATAKERLRLVLLSDHLSLAPDVVEALKKDLLAVISRYVEIDSDHADVTFEHREREVAMLASIPITGVRGRQAQRPPAPSAPLAAPPVHAAPPPQPAAPPRAAVVPAPAPRTPAAPDEAAAPELPQPEPPAAEAMSDPPAEAAPVTGAEGRPQDAESQASPAAAAEPGKVAAGATSANAARPRRRRRKKNVAGAPNARRAALPPVSGKPAAQA